MSKINNFWDAFNNQHFDKAITCFDDLTGEQKSQLLESLYQKSQNSRLPDVVSILYRKLHEGSTFNDFREAWLPSEARCNQTLKGDQSYLQFFPAPTRVINGVNINNPNEIISIGMTWINNQEQADKMLSLASTKNESNQERHDSIKNVADKVSSTLYEMKSDDHLGTPF
ncbi:hypothetical protein OAO18_07475 [Francisellaceae bacterium]|nr:hypothetical protein [Francisellaceae bacterium]